MYVLQSLYKYFLLSQLVIIKTCRLEGQYVNVRIFILGLNKVTNKQMTKPVNIRHSDEWTILKLIDLEDINQFYSISYFYKIVLIILKNNNCKVFFEAVAVDSTVFIEIDFLMFPFLFVIHISVRRSEQVFLLC